MSSVNKHISADQVAKSTPYDNTNSGLTSTDVQGAIDELESGGGSGASATMSFGRSGNSSPGTWLLCDTVPSNLTGRRVAIKSARIIEVFSDNQNLDTYTLEFYSHDGDSINLTLLTTLTVTAARGADSSVSINVGEAKQIGVKVASGSASQIVAGFIMKGNAE